MVTEPSTRDDIKAAFFCGDGQVHQWTYLRDKQHRYRCKLCISTITKDRLKELTDDA